jgi:very-short-patch-repair endonuclease
MIRRYTNHQLTQARRLRREMTVAETVLWRGLRDRGTGAKFRRQVTIGSYVVDFVCIASRIIIELDGPPHEKPEQRLHDISRDEWLRERGWRVLRFSNDLVTGGGNIVLEEIQRALKETERPSSGPRLREGHLLPQAGEGSRGHAGHLAPFSTRQRIERNWITVSRYLAWRSTPERESLVTVLLGADGGGTLLTLIHEQFFDEAARDRHEHGWNGSISSNV